tara:strand:- start:361 stop:474 length:114 start_codon:yes stop_codon:yes gene_type:complete
MIKWFKETFFPKKKPLVLKNEVKSKKKASKKKAKLKK